MALSVIPFVGLSRPCEWLSFALGQVRIRSIVSRTLVIANLRSQGGATGRRWSEIEARLREALGTLECEITEGRRDAVRIAREAVRSGVERIIVAGGDGTLNEVVSGILSGGLGGYAELGLLPLGTGNDFVRSLGIPVDLDGAIDVIRNGKPRLVDAGRVVCRGPDGCEVQAWFANEVSFGLSGLVVDLVNRASKPLAGRLSFLVGTLRGVARYRCQPVTLRLDGETVFAGPLVMASSANGQWFGGGMHLAPNAAIDDGKLDLIVIRELTRLQLVGKLRDLYSGAHLDDPAVGAYRGCILEAEAEPQTVWLEVDGEPVGTLPARIEVLPGALTVIGAA